MMRCWEFLLYSVCLWSFLVVCIIRLLGMIFLVCLLSLFREWMLCSWLLV